MKACFEKFFSKKEAVQKVIHFVFHRFLIPKGKTLKIKIPVW